MAIEDVEGVPHDVLNEAGAELDKVEQDTFNRLQEAATSEEEED